MLTITESCREALLSLSRVDRLTGTITRTDGIEIDLSEGNLDDGSVSISRECAGEEEIEFGSATMAQLNISLRTQESRYVFYDAKIRLVYGIKLADGSWFDIPLGEFTVAEADRKNALVALTAYDNLLLLDKDYGGAVLYGTPYEIMKAVCETCNVPLSNTEEEILAMPNGDAIIQVDENSGCLKYRDCAKIVAQMLGAFVVADRTGAITLRRYSKEPDIEIPKRFRTKTTMADYICTYMGIRIISTKGEFRSYDVEQEKGLELTIEDAPAWDYGLEETLQERADALLAELIQLQYTPGDFTMPGIPVLECGDMVVLDTDDGQVTTLITSYKWQYHNAMSVKSTGKNPYLKSTITRKTVSLRELQAQTDANRLIFYSFTNQEYINVRDDNEKEISQVTFATIEPTSAMFIAQLPVVVECADKVTTNRTETEKTITVKDATGTKTTILDALGNPLTLTVIDTDTVRTTTHGYIDLRVEYYINGTLVDYELIQRCHAGQHVLGLFYAFDSLDGNATYQWQVKLKVQGGEGTATVPKRGFRATITGQGLAGTDKWDGTINIDETTPKLVLMNRTRIVPVAEEVGTSTQKPTAAGVEENADRLALRTQLSLARVAEEIRVNPILEFQTIPAANLRRWIYPERYVWLSEDQVQLRTQWEYTSVSQSIDEGRMTVVKIKTTDLDSVDAIILQAEIPEEDEDVDIVYTAIMGSEFVHTMHIPDNVGIIPEMANIQIPENQSIIPAITSYANNVTMEGEYI